MEYTKGEWKVSPSNNSYVIGNGENWIARLFHRKGGFSVNSLAPEDNQVKANAHLIASAPDLYEACKQALIHSEIPTDSLPNHVIKQLEQAIAKAETN